MKSISLKLGILYIFLAILNIAFFTLTIFVTQMNLIVKNTEFKVKEQVDTKYSRITLISKEIETEKETITISDVIEKFKKRFDNPEIKKEDEEFIFFIPEGDTLYASEGISLLDEFVSQGTTAISNFENEGVYYYANLEELKENKKAGLRLFFPIKLPFEKTPYGVALFQVMGLDVNKDLNILYRLVLILIIMITLFHVGFAFILRKIIVVPIQRLNNRTEQISQGDYSARVNITSEDELGRLGNSFNQMAGSVEKTISELNRKNEIMEKELQMAAKVQQSIYPRITEKDKSFFDIAIYHRPLIEVSGDFHNIIPIGKDHYGIIIADVSGHGVAAALITMLIREHFLKLAPKYRDTKQLLKYINEAFNNLMTEYDKYFTAFYLIISRDRVVTFSNAAHPGAFVLRPGMKGIKVLDTQGVFIGLPPIVPKKFDSKRIRLKAGDKIVLYTDGIPEAINHNREFYTDERLQRIAVAMGRRKCQDMLDKIIEDYKKFADPEKRRDDETVIIIEMKAEG